MTNHLLIIAQSDLGPRRAGDAAPPAGTTGAPGTPAPAGGAAPGFDIITLMIFGLLFAFVISAFLGQRREKKKFDQMMSGLKRNDQVRTVGGIIGSIVEVKQDVVVLKVDESTNTKLTVARAKIEAVLKESVTSAE